MTELEKAIGKADKLKENEYTPNTYKTFKEALNNSKKVLNNLNATQENVDQTTKKLEKAMSSLVKRADLTKLNKKIAEAKKLDETKYTTKTYKVLKEVLHNAENISKDLNVTQSKVDAMVKEIEKAIMSLERVIEIDSDGQHKPGKPSIDENDSNQTSLESGTGVKTDDNTSIIIPLSLGIVALSGILYMIYLNKKVKKSKMS
ncbi:MAG: FIVAR domain-containing protein [Erysipelotrichales bacterium]|nr:FIVAR domain-containing protein [Erysipelotrichales bacterium]